MQHKFSWHVSKPKVIDFLDVIIIADLALQKKKKKIIGLAKTQSKKV